MAYRVGIRLTVLVCALVLTAPVVFAERLTDLIALVILTAAGCLSFEQGVPIALGGAALAGDLPEKKRTDLGLYVLTRNSNVRKGPGTEHGVLETLPAGSGVEVVGRLTDKNWMLVSADGAVRGYVFGNRLIKAPGTELELAPGRYLIAAQIASTDGTLIEIDTDDPQARQVFRDIWEERRDMLQAMCYRLNIILLPVRTDEEIHLSLIHSLEQRARSRAV